MTQEQLITRAKAWAETPMPKESKALDVYFLEAGALNTAITGRIEACTSCKIYSITTNITQYLLSPKPITQKSKVMASTKYEFTPLAKKSKTSISLVVGSTTKSVTSDTLTDKDAEAILNDKALNAAYGHNIQLSEVVETQEEPAGDDPEQLAAAKSEFEALTGEKPGNRKLSTLQAAIAEAKKAQ
jgi:hypothetical protein